MNTRTKFLIRNSDKRKYWKPVFFFMAVACIQNIMFCAKHGTCSIISFCCCPLRLLEKSERFNAPMALFQTTPLSRILILLLARHFFLLVTNIYCYLNLFILWRLKRLIWFANSSTDNINLIYRPYHSKHRKISEFGKVFFRYCLQN